MNQIVIKIKEKDWIIKQTFRGYMEYEEMTGKQISEIQTMKELLTLLYCTFKASNKDWNYTFNEFVDIIDEDPEIFTKFNNFNTEISTKASEKKRKVKD